jgi:uncharacterized transporter YbjL
MDVLAQGPIAKAVLALSIVAAAGLALGKSGGSRHSPGCSRCVICRHFIWATGLHIDERILEFVRDFGLLLFV